MLIITLSSALAFILHYNFIDQFHNWHGGSFQFLNQTKAITTGNIKELVLWSNKMEAASSDCRIPACYPWGGPLLYSIPYYFSNGNIFVLKIIQSLFVLITGFFVLLILKIRTNNLFAYLGLLVIIFNPYLIEQINIINASLISMCMVTVVIYLFDIDFPFKNIKNLILFSLILTFTTVLRSNNGLLYLIILLFFFKRDQPKNFLSIAILITPFLLYHTIFKAFIFGGSANVYFKFFNSNFLSYFLSNLKHYMATFSHLFFPLNYDSLTLSLSIGTILTLSLFLLFSNKKVRLQYITIHIVLHFFLLIIWPYQEGARLLIDILPAIILCTFVALYSLGTKIRPINVALLIVFSASTIAFNHYQLNKPINKGPFSKDASELFDFINSQNKRYTYVFFRPRVLKYFCSNNAFTTINPIDLKGKNNLYYVTINDVNKKRNRNLEYFKKKKLNYKIIFHNKVFSIIQY